VLGRDSGIRATPGRSAEELWGPSARVDGCVGAERFPSPGLDVGMCLEMYHSQRVVCAGTRPSRREMLSRELCVT
jgi:hypothetical protein